MRRTSDRIEAQVVLLVAVSYIPLAMLAAGYAGHWAYEAGVRAQHAVRARQVAAVVLTAAESTRPLATVWVPVRWTANGRSHAGEVNIPYGIRAGATVRVWVDRSGHVTTPPPTPEQLEDQVLTAKVVMPLLLAQILALSLYALRWYLNKRRSARWDSEWWSIDPA